MSRQKLNQQGIAHLALIALLVLIIAVAGFAAWRVTSTKNNKPATTNSTTSTKVATIQTGGNCGTETLDEADFSGSFSANVTTNDSSSSSSSTSKSGLTIENKCFNAAFKSCKAASLMAVANFTVDGTKADEQTDYAITGPKAGGCEVKQTYTKSMILPANLVGTDLVCTLDNTVIFTDALNKVANDGYKGCTGSFMEKSGA